MDRRAFRPRRESCHCLIAARQWTRIGGVEQQLLLPLAGRPCWLELEAARCLPSIPLDSDCGNRLNKKRGGPDPDSGQRTGRCAAILAAPAARSGAAGLAAASAEANRVLDPRMGAAAW